MTPTPPVWSRRATACFSLLVVGGCLSSAPPGPAVRWFDPLPAAEAAKQDAPSVQLRVTAAAHLGQQFLVRVGEREVAPDGLHAWIAEPRELVAAALAQQFASTNTGERRLDVEVEVFELDVCDEPRAVVRLRVQDGRASHVVAARVPAGGRSPEQLTAAMAAALQQVARDVAGISRS